MSDSNILENLRRNLEAAEQRISYPFLRSAVVVPFLYSRGRIQIVLELRADHLRRSPGEVGFPGGRIEPGESPWEAALRELEEEPDSTRILPGLREIPDLGFVGQYPAADPRADLIERLFLL